MKTDLECARGVADAKLGTAEELGWYLAFFVAWVVLLKWDSWLVAIAVFVLVVWAIGRYYAVDHDRLWAVQDPE